MRGAPVTAEEYPSGPAAARRMQDQNPHWLVLFGSWTDELVAFPLFRAPPGSWIAAKDAATLARLMRFAEGRYGYRHLAQMAVSPLSVIVVGPSRQLVCMVDSFPMNGKKSASSTCAPGSRRLCSVRECRG